MARILMDRFSSAVIVESPHKALDGLLRAGGIEPHRLDSVPDEDRLIEVINEKGAQLLFKRSRVPVTRRLLEACPSLMVVQLCCIGSDSVDLPACAEHGVLVFNDPISNGRSVVELVIGHLVALSRRLYETDVEMHDNDWKKTAAGRFEILDKTLGIVGLGNIGRATARAAEAMGMDIAFFDNRFVAQEVGVEMGWRKCESLEELFRTSDCVSIHTSARDARDNDNAGFLDDVLGELAAERGDNSPRIFLNLARGNLHTTEALRAAIDAGSIRRAAVDVYPEEPRPGQPAWENPYADEPRVTCTPHIGAATQEAQPRIARRVSSTVLQFSQYGALRDCVFQPRATIDLGDQVRGAAFLAVVHSVSRGTKKAVDDAIYEAEASNLGSAHRDFPNGVAYDLSVLDRPLSRAELDQLVERAKELAKDDEAIRSVRQVTVPEGGF